MSGDRITLEVKERGADQLGTRNVKRLRRQGLIPGVLYGKANKAFVVGERELRVALTGPSGLHAIVDVVIEGQKTPHHAVLKDYQQHPVRGTITHVDFHEVRLDQPIQATVVVQLVGEAPGSKVGGVVQQVARELHVEALPADIPEHIEVDVSSLELGDTLRLQDVPAIAGVTFLDDAADTVIANCSSPRGLTEAEEAADEALAAEASAESAAAAEAETLQQTRSNPCPSSGEASPPRRWTCSWSASAIPAGSTQRDRHNVGFMVVDELARRHDGSFRGKFSGQIAEIRIDGRRLGLLEPDTYMNESGRSVQPAVAFYKAPLENLLVVHDEVDLGVGRLQARLGGGLAGHNGLRSIAGRLGSPEFLRLRVGVGRPARGDPRDVADFVLAPFAPGEDESSTRHASRGRRRVARRRRPRRDAALVQLSPRTSQRGRGDLGCAVPRAARGSAAVVGS